LSNMAKRSSEPTTQKLAGEATYKKIFPLLGKGGLEICHCHADGNTSLQKEHHCVRELGSDCGSCFYN